MPDSGEKKELSGLARSIDSLFSEPKPTPVEEESVSADEESPPPVEVGFGPDPFESLEPLVEAAVVEPVTDGPEPELSFVEVEVPQEVVWEGFREVSDDQAADDEPAGPGLAEEEVTEFEVARDDGTGPTLDDEDATDVEVAADSDILEAHTDRSELVEEHEQSGQGEDDDELPWLDLTDDHDSEEVEVPPRELSGSSLADAVDAFLAGHPGAGTEVERIAARLQERLALDPLADAVERLVGEAEESPGDPALDMATKIVSPTVASRLVQRMAQEEDEDRRALYVGLAQRLGTVMANAFKGALTDAPDARLRSACHDGLIAMGDTSRPVIEAMIEDDNRFLVQNAVAILGDLGGEGAVELVTSALANTDFRVRREALAALAKLGGDESGQLVMASLDDADARVRAAAAEAAGQLGVERALRPMLALLDADLEAEEKVEVQVLALRGLGALGDPGAVQAIEKLAAGSLFSKPPTEVRVAAYRALHEIGTPHARAFVLKARDDKDPVVRTTARALASSESLR